MAVRVNENRMITRENATKAVFTALTAGVAGSCLLPPLSLAAEIEEIVVTARKKTETLQDIGVTVVTTSEEDLVNQRINSMSDYVLLSPSIALGGQGPGQGDLYIRGAATDKINIGVSESQGTAPNVALYLDEQPVTAGGRNLDVYMADMARIEVLPGPQGTLYGSSSQAGTVRMITNKPDITGIDAGFNGSSSRTSGGGPSSKLEAMINLPVSDSMAFRAVLFSDKQGGWIDNVTANWTPNPEINPALPSRDGIQFVPIGGSATAHQFADGSYAEPGKTYPVQYQTYNNEAFVKDDQNSAEYNGYRIGASWDVHEDWDLLLQHFQQTLSVEGTFRYDPEVGVQKAQKFFPTTLEDEFSQTSWTLEGRLAALDVIYTGAYLQRDVDHLYDYSEYVNIGGFIPGYVCEYNTPGYHGGGGVGYTFDPTLSGDPGVIECGIGTAYTSVLNKNERWTHEIRVNGEPTNFLSYTAGLYYQDREVGHIGDWGYPATSQWPALDPSGISRGRANSKAARAASVQFTNDIIRPETETALFGELTWRPTENLDFVLGLRQYQTEVGFEGFSAFRYGTRPVPHLAGQAGVNPAPTFFGGRDYATNLGELQPLKIKDLITKLGMSYIVNSDVMIYATISEGYRPPGFNRAAAAGVATPQGVPARANDGPGGFPDYFIPVIFESDNTKNYELGWKTVLMDRKVRFNGAVYFIDWEDIQISHFDSRNVSLFTIVDNAGNAEIRGFEGDIEFRPTYQLSLHAAFSFNDTELISVNPAFAFVVADPGSPLPITPKVQLSGKVRYEWDQWQNTAYWQLSTSYSSKSYNSLVDIPIQKPQQEQDPWWVLNATVGVLSNEGWNVEFFVDNLTNELAQLHVFRDDQRNRITTNRPRTMGVRLKYDLQ